jgi:hypothetical protein
MMATPARNARFRFQGVSIGKLPQQPSLKLDSGGEQYRASLLIQLPSTGYHERGGRSKQKAGLNTERGCLAHISLARSG